jgi:hypothetical protein
MIPVINAAVGMNWRPLMNTYKAFFALAATIFLLMGCSSATRNPISLQGGEEPSNQLTGSVVATAHGQTYLWGYYELYFDVENKTIEATPVRSVEFSANVVKFLNNDPKGVQVKFNGTTPGTGYVDIDMDITIKHPLSENAYDGYDVRGIFIGNGSSTTDYNPDLIVPVMGTDQYLLNADGYTRWFNPVEFSVPGMFGYTQGKMATKGFTGTATLNPYKYFGDGLGTNESLWDYLNTGDPETGYFLAGTSNTRNYKVRFPIPLPGVKYGYAVVANWSGPKPVDHPSHAPEAISIKVEDKSDLWFVDNSNKGGNLKLDISVFDWDAELTGGVMKDYRIFIGSTVQSSPYELNTSEMTPVASGDNWFKFHVEFPADNITDGSAPEMGIVVEDASADYKNSLGVPNAAGDDPLAAFFRYPLSVSSEEPKWIQVTSPNGGEQFKIGSSTEITWDSNPDIQNVEILMSSNSGTDFTQAISLLTPNDGSFIWDSIPSYALGTNDRIKIMDADNPAVFDTSNNDFSVTSPLIDVTAPTGGEEWKAGTSHDITWDADPDIANVEIELSINSGSDFILVIIPITPNTGIYSWDPVPFGITYDTCRIKVSDADCPDVYSISDGDFEIFQPSITLTSPNGGEELKGYMSWEITWESSEVGGTVNLEFSKDDFDTDVHSIVTNTANNGSYIWENIPFELSDTVSLRIVCPSPPMSDVSDSHFSIAAPPPFVRVLTPNGGESWGCGSSKEITWMSYGLSGNVDLYYSNDNFVSDNNQIASDVPIGDSYKWTVAGDFSDTVRVKVVSVDSPLVSDVSDANFSIIDAGWARTWGDSSYDGSDGVVVDAEGNSYVVGDAYDDGNMNSWTVLRRYDPAGKLEWDATWGSDQYVQGANAQAIIIDDSGNLYVIGSFTGTVDFDPGAGTDLHSTAAQYDSDIFLSKFDSDGTWFWSRTWGGPTYDSVNGVEVNGTNIYVVGSFNGTNVDFDPDPVDTDLHSSKGNNDAFLSRFDTSGEFVWAGTWGSGEYEEARDVAVADTGEVFVTGSFYDSVDFDPGSGEVSKSSNGSNDAFLSRFDEDNNFLGVETWGGTDNDGANSIALDGPGNVYVSGWFRGTDIDFDPGIGTDMRSSNGESDNFLSKFDSTTAYQWVRTWGSPTYDDVYQMNTDGFGNVFVTGGFEESVDFDPGPGSDVRNTNGFEDAYLTIFNTDGNYMMARTWGGNDDDEADSLFVTDLGAIYIVGYFDSGSVEFAPVGAPCFEDSDIHITNGNGDAFLVKFMPDWCW